MLKSQKRASQNFSYVRKVFQRKFTPLHETFFASEAPGRPKPKNLPGFQPLAANPDGHVHADALVQLQGDLLQLVVPRVEGALER